MTKPENTAAIEKATNTSWEQWVKKLDAAGAKEMTHKDLARTLYDQLDGVVENHGWWAQGITVAYEQHIGKRVPSQLANGLFELAVSKTIDISRNDLFSLVVEYFESKPSLNGREYTKPRSSETPKRSNWRCDFSDGSKFAATVEGDDIKSKLVLSHTSVPNQADADTWRIYWRKATKEISDKTENSSHYLTLR